MVARVDSLDDELIGVHRTWIERGASGVWRRRDRAMLGLAAGGAVRLGAAREDVPLVVGEGIESCFGAMQATDLPGWAALSAIGIERLILPTDLRDVLIAVDRDPNGIGERAARAAGRQWLAEGRRVRLLIPHVIGADAADLIGEARHAA
jgi:putative DNA primase/helicase